MDRLAVVSLQVKFILTLLSMIVVGSVGNHHTNDNHHHNSSASSHPSFHSSTSSVMVYPRFPEAMNPRSKDHPLKNKIEITNSCADCHADFHAVAYYRSGSVCEVKVRRLDKINWTFDIYIHIHSLHSENMTTIPEVHAIGPSPNSSFVHRILTTATELKAINESDLNSRQKIPRIIMQTYYTTNATNIYHWNAFMTFVELNPEYEILLMLDRHCRIFITKHFPPNVLKAYDALIPKAFKADLFRYCFLYIKGGCYFDNKMINRLPLRRTILADDDFLVCSDSLPYGVAAKTLRETKRYYNAVICSAPRDVRMLRAIRYVVDMVSRRNYGMSDLGISGPVAFFKATRAFSSESNLRFSHELGRNPYISKMFPKGHAELDNGAREYRDYFVNEKLNHEVLLTKFFNGYYSSAYRRYGDLWKQGKVFYELMPLSWQSYQLFIEPGVLPYYTVTIDAADGHITVQCRTAWNTYPLAVLAEKTKSFIRKNIILAGMGGLTDKIELKLLDTMSSNEYYIGLDVPSAASPRSVYSIRDHLDIHPVTSKI